MFGKDYDHLRCDTKTAQRFATHPASYIKQNSGQAAIRNIFSNQDYDAFEKKELNQMDQNLQEQGVDLSGLLADPGKRLKFLYAHQFDISNACYAITDYISTISDQSLYQLSKEATMMLEQGWLYIYGRDNKLRPIICINASKLDFEFVSVDEMITALGRILLIAESYMFVPGFIENWVILMDASNVNSSPQMIEYMDSICKFCNDCFPNNLEKLYVLNYSTAIKMNYQTDFRKLINPKIEQKIVFVKQDKVKSQLQRFINNDELETRFGGVLAEPIKYWPPFIRVQRQSNMKSSDNLSQRSRQSNNSKSSSIKGKAQINANKYVPNNFEDHPYMVKDDKIKQQPYQQKNDTYDLRSNKSYQSYQSKPKSQIVLITQQSQPQKNDKQDLYKEDLESRKNLQDEGIGACILI